jgi:small subunit ribosomal protein S16
MLVIRLFRVGKKNQPVFKIVVTDKRRPPRGGRFLEQVGFYNPLTKEKNINKERIKYWMSVGAKPSATVYNLLIQEKVVKGKKISVHKKAKKKEEKIEEKTEEEKPSPTEAPADKEEKSSEDTVKETKEEIKKSEEKKPVVEKPKEEISIKEEAKTSSTKPIAEKEEKPFPKVKEEENKEVKEKKQTEGEKPKAGSAQVIENKPEPSKEKEQNS